MLLFSEDTNRGGFGEPSSTSVHSQRAAPEIIRDLRTTTTAGELQPVDQLLLLLLTSLAYPRSALQSLSVRTHLVLRSKYPTLLMARTLQRSVNSAQSTVHNFNAFFFSPLSCSENRLPQKFSFLQLSLSLEQKQNSPSQSTGRRFFRRSGINLTWCYVTDPQRTLSAPHTMM